MNYDDETLMAYVDGELDAARRAEIAAALARDPGLARRIESQRVLRARVSDAFAPVLEQPVPEALRAAAAERRGTVVQFPARAARRLARPGRALKLLGPAPAAMAKRAARYHAQVLIEARERAPLHRMLAEWLPQIEALKPPRDLRWSLDVDPLDLF